MAKNPIRACARIQLSDQNDKQSAILCRGGRAHESFAECVRWPIIFRRYFNQSLRKKDLQCFEKRFNAVSSLCI